MGFFCLGTEKKKKKKRQAVFKQKGFYYVWRNVFVDFVACFWVLFFFFYKCCLFVFYYTHFGPFNSLCIKICLEDIEFF